MIFIILFLIPRLSLGDGCEKFRKSVRDAEAMCETGTDISQVCTLSGTAIDSVTGNGFAGLFCGIPGIITQILCSRTESKRNNLRACEEHELRVAQQQMMNAQGRAQREAYARQNIDAIINRYNQRILEFDNAEFYFDQFIKVRTREGADIESEEFTQEMAAWWDKVYKDQEASGRRYLEEFFADGMLWLDQIKEYGYTDWDDFINRCVRLNKHKRSCIASGCVSPAYKNWRCK